MGHRHGDEKRRLRHRRLSLISAKEKRYYVEELGKHDTTARGGVKKIILTWRRPRRGGWQA